MNLLKKALISCVAACSIAYAPSVVGLQITVNYTDDPGPSPPPEGFWDPVVGTARRAAFEHAVSIWTGHLDGTIPLVIKAEFNDMDAGVLGSSTRTAAWANLPGFPEPGWGFVAPLASQLNDKDRSDANGDHMFVQFNTDNEALPTGSDKWYYGTTDSFRAAIATLSPSPCTKSGMAWG